MRKGIFSKLAVQNIRNNKSTYIPYMITCILLHRHDLYDGNFYATVQRWIRLFAMPQKYE